MQEAVTTITEHMSQIPNLILSDRRRLHRVWAFAQNKKGPADHSKAQKSGGKAQAKKLVCLQNCQAFSSFFLSWSSKKDKQKKSAYQSFKSLHKGQFCVLYFLSADFFKLKNKAKFLSTSWNMIIILVNYLIPSKMAPTSD